ncbi:bacterial transferase hexapeptide [bacterium BMS3Abin05]|nr:bacterial transferase hexapeptide [bacterium BMS3Abin05]GBE28398.1 bacterial transferase hexapeptide [bacterium BMS3Bbin03]HDZ12983.1 hypothetical protein [Bacteroidota bacterium]
MRMVIFEDEKVVNFAPLTLLRPVYDLRFGILTLKEKLLNLLPSDTSVILHTRAYLTDLVHEQNPTQAVNVLPEEPCLFINGRALATRAWVNDILHREPARYVSNGELVAAYVPADKMKALQPKMGRLLTAGDFPDLPEKTVDAALFAYNWELVLQNGDEITREFQLFGKGGRILGKVYDGVTILNKENVFIDEGAFVKPGTVLDGEEGPIYIGKGAKILSNVTIDGPTFVGDKSLVKTGAYVYDGVSIGEVSKIGGEVEASIIHSFSNKQHDGFLGHAYLGQWVNLGSDTNNSDLKNNYSNVKVWVNGKFVDSGSLFVGLMMGDHSKAGIDTMFNTGTVVGVLTNVFGAGFPPKFIPSFSWGGADGLVGHQLEKALETANKVMNRRQQRVTPALEKAVREVYRLTEPERTVLK